MRHEQSPAVYIVRLGLSLLAISCCCVSLTLADNNEPVTTALRGYGTVTARFSSGRAQFDCDSPEHAAVLQSKLLDDLFWDAGKQVRAGQSIELNGVNAIVHQSPSYGAIIVGRLDKTVVAAGAADIDALKTRLATETTFRDPRCQFDSSNHPLYLDVLDLRAIKFYQHTMQSNLNLGLSTHWDFINKFGLGGISYNLGGGMVTGKSPAPGVLDLADVDFEVQQAQSHGGLIVPSFSTGGLLSIWAANMFPQSVMQHSPLGIWEDGGEAHPRESLSMPRDQREITGLWSLRRIISRYLNNPAVGGWQIYLGTSGIETLAGYQLGMDFSQTGLASYRNYLQKVKGFDLKAVGSRYFNDPAHYQSWDQVLPLDEDGFFGHLDDSCVLFKNWQWQSARAAASPEAGDAQWKPVLFPGSDQMLALPMADAFFRTEFDASPLTSHSPGDIYLILGRILAGRPPQHIKAWLNGTELINLEALDPKCYYSSGALKVNELLQPGKNELTFWVPNGKLLTPFFLTPHKPEAYPCSDKTQNARFVDLKDWHFDDVAARHRDAFELARQIDPNRFLTLAAAGGWELAGDLSQIAIDYGSSMQNTGREAFYQPWWPRLGRIAGFYGTSEPSGTTKPDPAKGGLDRLFGWVLIDGDTSEILFHNIEEYMQNEQRSPWFEKHERLLSLVGKSLPEPPPIAVFRSAMSMRYSPEHYASSTWTWDIGRGELNAAHLNWGYASERELSVGLPKTCRVLFDAASEEMDDASISSIARFVSDGGTFVALHDTGRNSPIEANAWPISRLTGCDATARTGGKIRFVSSPSVWRALAGDEFEQENNSQCISLKPQSSDVEVLATWEDGSAAITSRTMGKGRVICLGSTFWRDSKDVGGVWVSAADKLKILAGLFTDLGVERDSDASSSDLWVGKYTTKNGLQDWLIAFNTSHDPQTVDLKLRADKRPDEVIDLTANKPVPFDYSDGWIQLTGIKYDSMETKAFAIKHADFADGLSFWWGEKTKYWKQSQTPPLTPEPQQMHHLPAIQIESWKSIDDTGSTLAANAAWNSPAFDDGPWKTIPANAIQQPAGYTGTRLYRASVSIPDDWKGSSISLNLYSPSVPCLFGSAEFFVNGKKIETKSFYDQITQNHLYRPATVPISDFLTAGKNELAVKITGGAKQSDMFFSGFGSAVYLSSEKPLNSAIDLAGPWTVGHRDQTTTQITVPFSKTNGTFLAKELEIPASWAGHDIRLRLQSRQNWLKGVFVNGTLLDGPGFNSFGTQIELNITGDVQPGKNTKIELWDGSLPIFDAPDPLKGEPKTEPEMDLITAQLGCLN